MILSATFRRFRASEFIQFFSDFATICTQSNPEQLNFGTQFEAFNQSKTITEQSFKQRSKSNITAELTELDQRRDSAIICLNRICEGYLSHFDNSLQEAAEQINNCISKYGNTIYRLNYQAETSVVASLTSDLNNKHGAAIQALHLADIVAELANANSEFNVKFIERIEESTEDTLESTTDLIKDTIEKYRVLCKHIEAHATIAPSQEYTTLIDTLNTLINRYNNTMSMRQTVVDNEIIDNS